VVNRTRSLFLLLYLLTCGVHPSHADQASHNQPPADDSVTITRSTFASIPLRTSNDVDTTNPERAEFASASSSTPLVTVASSLAIVLGLFAALVWVSRRTSKNLSGNRELPDEALRILGKKSLGASGSIALVRCGRTVLVVGVHPSGMSPLGQVTDEDEVRHLEAICDGRSKASFDETLAEMEREPTKRGFIGEEIERPAAASRHRLFTTS
jgi:flagellar biogenesis protein FliO